MTIYRLESEHLVVFTFADSPEELERKRLEIERHWEDGPVAVNP
jgi:hypothetical protein